MYKRARKAMMELEADELLLEEYKVLEVKHLQLNKDITEENRFYQRNDTLPWFWMVGVDIESTDWKQEGIFLLILIYIKNNNNNHLSGYRINWLRAKARYDRWKEEKIWVVNEMKWVQNWFGYKKNWWTRRAEECEKEGKQGHAVYAWKQAGLWDGFMNKAEEAFKLIKN
jgi:hypothetical protein